MQRFIKFTAIVALSVVFCHCAIAQDQDIETFQVPDLAPPSAPDPAGGESIPVPSDPFADDEGIPAESAYPGTALGLFDALPMPYALPGAHLWAGYCDGCETLVVPNCCPPTWVSVDALWLQRQGPDDYLLANNAQDELWNDQFKFNYEAGVRVTYGELVNCTPVEITYFGTHSWNSSIELDSALPLVVPGAPGGGVFAAADEVEASYSSELHSIEFNVLRFKNDRLTWVTGLRYVDVEEDFLLDADAAGGDEGTIVITDDNRLLGLQGGADYNRELNGWCLAAYGRAGLFVNFAERDWAIEDEAFSMNDDNDEDNDTELAFVGQLGVGVTRHLGCGLKLRGGYELLWIDGLALAAEQLGTGGIGSFDTSGDTLYDGGYLGLEWQR